MSLSSKACPQPSSQNAREALLQQHSQAALSAAELVYDIGQHRLEHGRGQPPGVRVLARAVVAVEEHVPGRKLMTGAVRKGILAALQSQSSARAVMGDAAKRQDGA